MSEVKTMSSIQFPNTQQPYQVNDARIPSDSGAYQQMVTDGEGNWGVADRLAWKEGEKVEITWDGNTDGLESTFMGDGYWYYKVSSLVLTDDAIRNGTVSILQAEGTIETAVDSMSNIFEPEVVLVGEVVPGIPAIIFTREENITLGNYTFVSSGVWFLKTNDSYTNGFTCVEETIHPIPAEYLSNARFVVNVTTEDFTYTADKTMEQVVAAHKAGMSVVAVLQINMNGILSDNVLPFVAYAEQDGNIMLCSFSAISIASGTVAVSVLNMTANGVTHESAQLAEKEQ